MKVRVRSNEKCRDCGLIYKEGNNFYCKSHDRFPRKVYIEITGIEDYPKGRVKIYTNKTGEPLTPANCFALKDKLITEIKNKTFNIKFYLPRDKNEFLFKNYKLKFLGHLEKRNSLPKENDNWITKETIKNYRSYVKNHFESLDEIEINEIKKKHITDLYTDLSVKYKRCYIKDILGGLKTIFRWAYEREDINRIPEFPKFEVAFEKKKAITLELQEEILQAIPERDQPIFEWFCETGRRLSNIRGFMCKNINLDEAIYETGGSIGSSGEFKPFPKTKSRSKEIWPITERGKEILKRALKDRIYRPDDYVFLNKKRAHYKKTSMEDIFSRAVKKSGYAGRGITLYAFGKHTLVDSLINSQKRTFEEAAIAVGTTTEMIKKHYGEISIERKRELLENRKSVRGMSVAKISHI